MIVVSERVQFSANKMLVIDLQGFYIGKQFIVKELAAYDGHTKTHFVFKPPFDKSFLSNKDRRQVQWLENNYHRLDWNCGFVDLDNLNNILKKMESNSDVIYVKGKQKCKFLKQYIDNVLEFPHDKEFSLRDYRVRPKCSFHNGLYGHCSLSNVKLIFNYVEKYYYVQ